MSKRYGVKARLKSDGNVVDISDFTFTVATGELGSLLGCSLAAFEPVIDESLPVTFEIGITKGGNTDWAMLLADGRIKALSDATQFSGDQTSISAISKLAEKWRLTPPRPVTLYDPAQVDIITESAQGRRDIVDANGNAIEPLYTPVASLDLNQLLRFIYVDKLGFGQVITNIPNYPLPRADFDLQSPWHSVAASQIGLFEPKYASDGGAMLFILDPQAPLPAGFASQVRACGPGSYAELQKTKQTAPEVNGVLLTYKDASNTAGNITDRVDQEIQEVGTFGHEGWQRTMVNRSIKEFHSDPNNPDRITREIVWRIETRISAKADGLTREVSIETQTDQYDYDWQLKRGYVKTVQLYTKLPSESAKMRMVQTETNQIIWTASNSNSGELLKTWEVTEVNGTIIQIGEDEDPDNPAFRQSLYDANRTADIPDDADVHTGRPISTIIERWREVGPDQIEVSYQRVDHLRGKPDQNKTVQHTGTVTARLDRNSQIAVTMLLRDEVSITANGNLPPASLDAGDIPFGPALELANRVLARHGQQPQKVAIQFAGLDLSLRRGSLRRVLDRAGNEYLVFITGYSITGRNLGTVNFSVTQQADGFVLQPLT